MVKLSQRVRMFTLYVDPQRNPNLQYCQVIYGVGYFYIFLQILEETLIAVWLRIPGANGRFMCCAILKRNPSSLAKLQYNAHFFPFVSVISSLCFEVVKNYCFLFYPILFLGKPRGLHVI